MPEIYKEETGSTNDDLKALAAFGAEEFTLIWAGSQTKGRGRRGRSWEGNRGNLYCSLLLRPNAALKDAALITYVASLALLRAGLRLRPEGRFACKWPNDLLYNEGKAAGILLEAEGWGSKVDWLVLGVGVNLAGAPELALYPTAALGEDIKPELMLRTWLGEFRPLYQEWQDKGFAPIREAWLLHAHRLGEEIRIDMGGQVKRGVFQGLDQDGALLLGEERILAGDMLL